MTVVVKKIFLPLSRFFAVSFYLKMVNNKGGTLLKGTPFYVEISLWVLVRVNPLTPCGTNVKTPRFDKS